MMSTIQPQSIDELSQAIRDTTGSIVPTGGGTQLDFGNPLRSSDHLFDLRRLNRITAYNPADMTIHLEAGVTLGELQTALSANNQILPLDPWNGPDATLGGIAATNAQGPLRATGTIRNWIIGMKVAHADGELSKTGGRVVKNVTGYDLAKLYTGSIGTLAVIAEISLKLRSGFPQTATAIAEFADIAESIKVLREIRTGPLQPISCEFVGPAPAIWIRFGDHPDAVKWQLSHLPRADWQLVGRDEEPARWEMLRKQYLEMGPIVVRVISAPANLGDLIQTFNPRAWVAHASNGIVFMSFHSADPIASIRQRVPVILERAPMEIRRQVPTFGVGGPELELMNRLKRAMDPGGRLNPGKHVDGE
jgi:glycolate oxidase FAD binding subunit